MPQTPVGEREQATPATRIEDTSSESPVRQEGPVIGIFWESPALEELARAQNVQPLTDVQVLFGTWPGDEDDGFEEAVYNLRHAVSANSGRRE
ncbi:MAG: hypothetical protein OXC27_01395 [Caldilineaceae bacterium]|nr:hypothetical protein [Caldilineaceae bacterium]